MAAVRVVPEAVSRPAPTGSRKPFAITYHVLYIHRIASRTSCEGCSEECPDAKSEAEAYRADLEKYAKRLYSCAEENDLTDDCHGEFRRIKSVYSDFEDAVSEVESYCD